ISAPDDTGRLPILSTTFRCDQPRALIKSAQLVATAHGTYEPRLDGAVVTSTVLNPGWTAYEWRLQYQSFDVTNLLTHPTTSAENNETATLSFLLGEG